MRREGFSLVTTRGRDEGFFRVTYAREGFGEVTRAGRFFRSHLRGRGFVIFRYPGRARRRIELRSKQIKASPPRSDECK